MAVLMSQSHRCDYNVTVANGLVRVDCLAVGPNSQQLPSGTLLIPGTQIGPVLNALVNAMKELQRKQEEQAAEAGTKQ